MSWLVREHAPSSFRLGDQLRALRESSGKPQREVAGDLGWSLSKLQRIEAGHRSVAGIDLDRLIEVYRPAPPVAAYLRQLAAPGRDRATSTEFADVLAFPIRRFMDYESSATRIRNYEPQIVPGLLQTPNYARAVLEQLELVQDDEIVDRLVAARTFRQRILSGFSPVHLEVIVDESVLTRAVGGAAVMVEQLRHLRGLAGRTHVLIGVVPHEVGAYPGMRSSFIVMDFLSPDQDQLLFLEDPVKELLVIGRGDPGAPQSSTYDALFAKIRGRAAWGGEAFERIDAALRLHGES